MTRYPFICVEGIDGVGKTEVAIRLARRMCGSYYKTPPPPYAYIRQGIDSQAPPLARFAFYLSSVLFASMEIARMCESHPVICDRYIYSTLAYHAAMDDRIDSRLATCWPSDILLPDHAFLLIADEEERVRRIRGREGPRHDARLESDGVFLGRVQNLFRGFRLKVVDTTGVDEAQVVERIAALLTEKVMHRETLL